MKAKIKRKRFEKGVPAKVIKKYDSDCEYSFYNCPNCNNFYVSSMAKYKSIIHRYCSYCGQKLDWSGIDENLSQ